MYEQTELYVADVTWVVGRGISLGMLRDTYYLLECLETLSLGMLRDTVSWNGYIFNIITCHVPFFTTKKLMCQCYKYKGSQSWSF